jgi:amino acid transporter
MAVHSSMLTVLTLFVGANLAYFVVLDPQTVASSNTVALDFGRVVIGKLGAVVFSALVAISCFGALSNGFYTSELWSLKPCFGRADWCSRTVDLRCVEG